MLGRLTLRSQQGTRIANAHCSPYTLAPSTRVYQFEEVLAPMVDILRNIMNEIGKPVRSLPGQPKVRNNGVPFMIHYENPTINFKIVK